MSWHRRTKRSGWAPRRMLPPWCCATKQRTASSSACLHGRPEGPAAAAASVPDSTWAPPTSTSQHAAQTHLRHVHGESRGAMARPLTIFCSQKAQVVGRTFCALRTWLGRRSTTTVPRRVCPGRRTGAAGGAGGGGGGAGAAGGADSWAATNSRSRSLRRRLYPRQPRCRHSCSRSALWSSSNEPGSGAAASPGAGAGAARSGAAICTESRGEENGSATWGWGSKRRASAEARQKGVSEARCRTGVVQRAQVQ